MAENFYYKIIVSLTLMKKLILGIRFLKHKLFSGFFHLGWKVAFDKNLQINHARHIYLGNNVYIESDCVLSVIKGNDKLTYNFDKYKSPIIKIEDRVNIAKGTIIYAVNSVI